MTAILGTHASGVLKELIAPDRARRRRAHRHTRVSANSWSKFLWRDTLGLFYESSRRGV